MKTISFFDPSVCSANMADNWITQICYDKICSMFPDHIVVKVSSHNSIDEFSNFRIKNASFSVIGGTGIMSACMPGRENFQWKNEAILLPNNFFGMGLGFENKDIVLTKELGEFYRRIFGDQLISVRGNYTFEMLTDLGVACINTGCPTLWNFNEWASHRRKKNVVFNFNSYRKVNHRDYFEVLKNHYDKIYFYCQHYLDEQTLREEFPNENIELTPVNFNSLKNFCLKNDCDFVGTRVHSSIYCMKNQIRTIVIDTDCRTTEVIGEIGLPLVKSPEALDEKLSRAIYYSINYETKKNVSIWEKETIKKANLL